jgi:hypothetical protein
VKEAAVTTVMFGVDPAKRSHAMSVFYGQEEQLAALQVVNDRDQVTLRPG